MHRSSSRLGQPVLVYISIVSAALVGLTLTSFGDGSSGNSRAMTFINNLFPKSSVTGGGSCPLLGNSNIHLIECSVTEIYFPSPMSSLMFSGSNMSINQLINSRLSSDLAASCSIPPTPIFCIVVLIHVVNVVLMNDLISEGEHLATWECARLSRYSIYKVQTRQTVKSVCVVITCKIKKQYTLP
jgi:hypothetical protein